MIDRVIVTKEEAELKCDSKIGGIEIIVCYSSVSLQLITLFEDNT